MPRHTLFRIAGIALVVCAATLSPDRSTFKAIIFSLGLAHYVTAILYAKRPIRNAWSGTTPRILLLATVGASLLAFQQGVSLVLLFGLHHAFNEVYVLDRWTNLEPSGAGPAGGVSRLRTAGVWLNLLAYLVILRKNREVEFINDYVLYVGLLVSLVVFARALLALRPSMTPATLLDNCGLELLALVGVGLSFKFQFLFLDIVAFHFCAWLLYPLPAIAKGGSAGVARFYALSVALTLGFLGLSEIGPYSQRTFRVWFLVGSYLHIITAVAISSAHPRWIRRWFEPRPAVTSG
ncbi:MAG: hypothetical protein ACYTCU_00625 [Planctomycetota bacterium]|jgi:hypothetical protein